MTTARSRSAILAALITSALLACGGSESPGAPAAVVTPSPAPAPTPAPVAVVRTAAVRVSAYGAAGATRVTAQAGDVEAELARVADGEFVGTLELAEGQYDVLIGAYADPDEDGSLDVVGLGATAVTAILDRPASVHAVLTGTEATASPVKALKLGEAAPVVGAWLPFQVQATNPDGSVAYVTWWSDNCVVEYEYEDATLTRGNLRFVDGGACRVSLWGWSAANGWEEFKFTIEVVPAPEGAAR